jgi:hypothetical protein
MARGLVGVRMNQQGGIRACKRRFAGQVGDCSADSWAGGVAWLALQPVRVPEAGPPAR